MKLEAVLRWTARVWGIASTLLLLAFAFGGREHIRFSAGKAITFLAFPVGVIVGLAVAWRRELTGGLITIGSLALFYLLLFARVDRWPSGPFFLLFAEPGFLHVASFLVASRRGRGVASADLTGEHGDSPKRNA